MRTPAAGQTPDGRTHICEVLGVDIDQPFNINYPCRAYNCLVVRPDGKVWETGPYPHKIGSNALYYLIEHKDEIIRKPRFTQEEVAVLRHMASVGIVSIEKKSDTHLYWDGDDFGAVMVVPPGFLPSLRPGQSVRLEDILEANS